MHNLVEEMLRDVKVVRVLVSVFLNDFEDGRESIFTVVSSFICNQVKDLININVEFVMFSADDGLRLVTLVLFVEPDLMLQIRDVGEKLGKTKHII